MKTFEYLEHPADLKIRAFGQDLPELFIHSAQGMVDFLYELFQKVPTPKPTHFDIIEAEGSDLESLLVNFLSELLCYSDTHHRAAVHYEVEYFDESKISAKLGFIEATPKDDIKAVTYHELAIKKQEGGWMATVVFDI
ncbi:MAG: archease [Gammaproteobacteria bacterium]|nr:archease [Gammaproteobacteria bacterium]